MFLKEGAAEGDRRECRHLVNEVRVKALADHRFHEPLDSFEPGIVFGEMADSSFELRPPADLGGVARKLEHCKSCQVAGSLSHSRSASRHRGAECRARAPRA